MKKLIIVGAGGFARELADWIEDINDVKPTWDLLGFIDDNPDALSGIPCKYKVIGSIQDWNPLNDESFVCGLAIPKVKRKVIDSLKSRGAKFVTIVHPSAIISDSAFLGEGVVVTPRSGINANSYVGDYVSVLESGIGHDAHVGSFSTLSGRVNVNGHVFIGEGVYVGCAASIAPGKRVGDDASISIGSVVISNVKSGRTVFGNPAKIVEI